MRCLHVLSDCDALHSALFAYYAMYDVWVSLESTPIRPLSAGAVMNIFNKLLFGINCDYSINFNEPTEPIITEL
jgi:hypothetical protein